MTVIDAERTLKAKIAALNENEHSETYSGALHRSNIASGVQDLRAEITTNTSAFKFNTAQRGDALELLRSLPPACAPLMFLDPQYREVLDHLRYGNEGARQRGRAALPAMSSEYIDECCREAGRIVWQSGYLFVWCDTYRLCNAHHLRVADTWQVVDLVAWDSLRIANGYRTRRRGDYLVILQRPPLLARTTWSDRGIPSRWPEAVDRKLHPHIKPSGLIKRLIGATTRPGDLVIDPAAGSFTVMHAAHELGRNFIGVDLLSGEEIP